MIEKFPGSSRHLTASSPYLLTQSYWEVSSCLNNSNGVVQKVIDRGHGVRMIEFTIGNISDMSLALNIMRRCIGPQAPTGSEGVNPPCRAIGHREV